MTKIDVTTEEVCNCLTDIWADFDREQFCRVFYDLGPGQDVSYMDEKWGYFQRNGLLWVYAHLDRENRQRVWAYIEERIAFGYKSDRHI